MLFRSARTIENLSSPLAQAVEKGEDLTKIPGVGKAISEKIAEFIETGEVAAYQRLLGELPPGVLDIKNIPGIGPKTAVAIGRELGISTVAGVAEAAAAGRLAELPRMGKKAAEGGGGGGRMPPPPLGRRPKVACSLYICSYLLLLF